MNQNKSSKKANCGCSDPSCANDAPLNRTSRNGQNTSGDPLRTGFSGQVQQYDPNDCVLPGNEQSRHPRMLRSTSYETHSGTMETFRQGQPQRRQPGSTDMNISDLPEECLADMSPPGFDLSLELPSSVNDTNGECLEDVSAPSMIDECKTRCDNENNSYMDCLYNEISGRFKQLTDKMRYRGSEPERLENSGNNEEETLPCSQQNEIINQASACCMAEILANQSIHSLLQSRLEDESMPCVNESEVFASRSPNKCVEDTRQQQQQQRSFLQSPRRQQQHMSMTMPTQNLCDVSAPSMLNSTRDETSKRSKSCGRCQKYATTFNNSMGRPKSSTCIGDMNLSGPRSTRGKSLRREQFPRQSSRRGQMTNECLEDMTMPTFAEVSEGSRDRTLSKLQRSIINECLDEMTMPSYAGVSGASSRGPQNRSQTMECLDEMTMPSYGGVSGASRRSRGPQNRSLTMECLDDMTMPSFQGVSGSSRSRRRGPQNRSLTMECLDDMTMPSYAGVSGASRSRSRGPQNRSLTMECLDEMTMPSYAGVSGASRSRSCGPQNRSQTMECLDDMTMPSFQGVSGSSRSRSRGPQNTSLTMECLDEMTMPSYPGVSGASRSRSRGPQNRSLTMECLDEMTMPSYAGVSGASRSRSRGPLNRSQTMECLDDMTMPSYAGVSGASRSRSRGPQNRSLTMECLDEMTMPSYAGVSGASRSRSRGPQNRSLTMECLDEMTMPSYAGVSGASRSRSRGPQNTSLTMECLDEMTMPSYAGVSGASRSRSRGPQNRSQTMECLDDMTMPSFQGVSGSSRSRSRGPQNRSLTMECLDDMTMPSFQGVSGSSRSRSRGPQNRSLTMECLDEMTMPSFAEGTGSSRGRTLSQMQRCMINECLDEITIPSYADVSVPSRRKSTGQSQSSRTNECLEDMTMPSYEEVSRGFRERCCGPYQRSMGISTDQCLENMTMPSFGSSGRNGDHQTIYDSRRESTRNSGMTDERLEDMTMPSFGGVHGSSRRSGCCNEGMGMTPSPRQRASHFSPCLSDRGGRRLRPRFSATATIINNSLQRANTSGATSRRGSRPTDECLDDVSMPQEFLMSHNASKSLRRCTPDISYPMQQLADESAPALLQNETGYYSRRSTPGPQHQSFRNQMCNDTGGRRLEDVTMPSFQDEPSYQLHRVSMSSERLEDISDPCQSQFDDDNEYFDGSAPPMSSTRSEKPQAKSSPCKAEKSRTETKTVSKKSTIAKQRIDKNAMSSVKDASSQVNPDVMQVTVSQSTVTRTYNNADRPGNSSGQDMIEDITMPSFESLTQSYHGASSVDNYALCDDLQNANLTTNECQNPCPEKVRAQPKRTSPCKDCSSSQRQSNKRKHC